MAVNISIVSSYSGRGVKQAITDLDSFQKAAQIAGGGFAGHMQAMGAVTEQVGKKIQATGRSLTTSVTVPLVAVGAGLYKATQSASDLAETQSKVGVVFGKSAKAIETWAATADTKMGQSKQQAMDAAATFAIFGKSAGLAGEDLVDFSTGFAGVASDMASFANTSPEEAILAIGAALRGETEPIRKYGVLLDDASLRQEALAQGLIKTTKEALTPQQKVLASQALIYKQLGKEGSNTIGDFERTSEGLANQQRILQAQLKNTTTEIGTELLPIALDMVNAFRTKVMPVIQQAVDAFKNMSPETQRLGLMLGAVAAAVGPFMMVFGKAISVVGVLMTKFGSFIGVIKAAGGMLPALQAGFAALTGPVALVVIAIVGAIAAIVAMWRESETFRNAVKSAFQAVKNAVVGAINTVKGSLESNKDAINALKTVFKFFGDYIGTVFIPIIKFVLVAAIKIVAGAFDILLDGISVVARMFGTVARAIEGAITWFKNLGSAIKTVFSAGFSKLGDIGKNIVEGIWKGISGAAGWLMDKIKGFASGVVNGIKGFFGISSPAKVMIPLGQYINQGLAKGITKEKSTQKAMAELAKSVADGAKAALDKFKEKAREVLDFAKGVKEQVRGTANFGDMMSGLAEGQAPTAEGIRAYLTDKLTKYKALSGKLSKLQGMGLPSVFIQDIIAAGPDGGNQLADAILGGGSGFVKELKGLDSKLNAAASSIGATAALSEYGMSTSEARGVVNSTVKVEAGAIVLNVGAGVDKQTAAEMKTAVTKAVQDGLKDLASEYKKRKKK